MSRETEDVWLLDGDEDEQKPQPLSAKAKAWELRQVKRMGLEDVEWDPRTGCSCCTGGIHVPPSSTRRPVQKQS